MTDGSGRAVSSVDPATGSVLIGGYPVPQLAAGCSMEQVAWLLHHGELPSATELAGFERESRAARSLPPAVAAVVDAAPLASPPMQVLRAAVEALADGDADALPIRLFARVPGIVARDLRRRRGQRPVDPSEDLDWCADFLWQAFGEVPGDVEADAFRVGAVLHAEPAADAATRAARAAAPDARVAVLAALAAVESSSESADAAVLDVLHGIANVEALGPWLDEAIAGQRAIPGFAEETDERVPAMRAALGWLVAKHEAHGLAELVEALQAAMLERTGLHATLALPSGPTRALLGFDAWTFAPLTAAARVAAWSAHGLRGADPWAGPRSGPVRRDVPAEALTAAPPWR